MKSIKEKLRLEIVTLKATAHGFKGTHIGDKAKEIQGDLEYAEMLIHRAECMKEMMAANIVKARSEDNPNDNS